MKILWIVNILLPELCKELLLPINPYGGWLVGLSNQLKEKNIDLHIVAVDNMHAGFSKIINGITYHIVDNSMSNWLQIENTIKPHVVHIHGTEFNYGMQYIKANSANKVVFSIQGLVSVYEKFYFAGISKFEILRNISFRDILRRDSLLQAKRKFKEKGKLEREYFKLCKHVIGRTDWDKAHTWSINSEIKYHYGGEILRESFYVAPKWKFETCIPHTIFLSQASYPIKGLHQVIKALPFLVKDFPNIKVKIAGSNLLKKETFSDKLKRSGYAKYLLQLIKKCKVEDHIEFLGNLSEEDMINEYLKANVFVCPSAIENSPNSLAEAQILGIPTVSAYVGGVPNMVNHDKDGWLYRFEEVEMLAYYLKNIFDDKFNLKSQVDNSIELATKRHSKISITNDMISIYKQINNIK